MNGIVLVDKPAGISSFGVVSRVRRQLSQQAGHRVKVGHTGTLDPFATGLLILVVGQYTKRASELLKLDKVYEATLQLGQVSSTGDPEGEITDYSQKVPTLEKVTSTLNQFVGEIEQIPPAYSAIKINGQRAYKLARAGKAVKLEPRKAKIHAIDHVQYVYPSLSFTVHAGSGTYIRTLAEDIGQRLGTGAYLKNLRRTRVGDWTITKAGNIDNITQNDIIAL